MSAATTRIPVTPRPLREEFRLARFSPRGENAIHLASSPFVQNSTLLAIRVAFAAYVLVLLVLSGVTQGDVRWLIFLTNWTYAVLCLFLVSNVCVSAYDIHLEQAVKDDKAVAGNRNEWGKFHSVHNTLYTLCVTTSLVVSVLYWTLLSPRSDIVNVSTHAVNSVMILIDLGLSNTSISILHIIYTWAYAIVYVVFSLIFTLSGGTNPNSGDNFIYSILDWSDKPGTAVLYTFLTIFIVMPFFHGVSYFLFRLRVLVAAKVNGPESPVASDNTTVPMQAMA